MHRELHDFYRAYIACLNAQAWHDLSRFVAGDVIHNGRRLGLAGYRDMLAEDFAMIPDLAFRPGPVVAEAPFIAARLDFDCTPRATFLGLAVDGRRVTFAENVFYEIRDGRIGQVWSVIDKAAIEAALRGR